jgi:aryl-alcohol dehydrogenase-like predicted oxidoreductase
MAYAPLGRGFLSGAIKSIDSLSEKDGRRNQPRFQPENLAKNLELLEKIEKIANQKNVTIAQLALAWVHSQAEDVFPIPGTKHVSFLDENLAAFDIALNPEEQSQLSQLFPKNAAAGYRYPEPALKGLGI